MTPAPDPRSENTRAALLEAAATIFARDGFKAARTSDIAAAANTPISAINYHFGGKQGLYEATVVGLAEQRISEHPLPAETLAAEERLRGVIQTILNRLFSDAGSVLVVRLLSSEITQSGPALTLLADTIARPQAKAVIAILKELLGHDTDEAELQRWFISLMGQCLVYQLARPMLNKLFPDLYPQLDRNTLAQHIANVMLDAIHARQQRKVQL
jgi:AcrR family transcriptional regulator